jgi:dihydrofolate reductase
MPRLVSFTSVSLDGYFTGKNDDIGWMHRGDDPDFQAFTADSAQGGGRLLFGRITYGLMEHYWPTAQAAQNESVVAERMTQLPKIVFSRTMHDARWRNTRLVSREMLAAVHRLKEEDGPDMVILGSGSIVCQLTEARLIDEYQIVIVPTALGEGRSLFHRIREPLNLKLLDTRSFPMGKLFLRYAPRR